MKSHVLLPVLTAAAGFAAAWIAKPAPETPPVSVVNAPAPVPPPRPVSSHPENPAPRDPKRPAEVKAGDFPLADRADQGPKTREDAKMGRLTEALGLSTEQQGAFIKLIQDVQATASSDGPVLADLATRGKALEDGLQALLSPDQFAKFQEIRARERENRTELRAHQQLGLAIQEIDLSPEQRDAVLARLRQKAREDLQLVPAAATLFFEKSILPTGGKELPVEGVLLLAKAGEPVAGETPVQVRAKILDEQRAELEQMLKCFDGILTPAQMNQYSAGVAEQRALAERLAMQRHLEAERRESAPPVKPPAQPERVSEDWDEPVEED